jgi:site-specific DNA-methyltransferase (adenine-specific)
MNNIFNDDFLNNNLPDKSQQLIIADPPYFEVKGDFDFKWKSFDDYLKDVEKWAIECKRLLADNGSLFWWGHAKKIAYSQIILDKYFNLQNSLIWEKIDSMQCQYYSLELSRCFNTHNERVLFYTNDYEPSDWNKTGTEKIHEEFFKPNNPFSKYLKEEFKKAKVTLKQIAKLFPSKTGGLTGCVSNWLNGDNVITKEQYLKIRKYLNNEYLRKEYEELRKEYEELRRPFNNILKLSDVIKWSQESNISKHYDHDTIKPLGLIRELIKITTRENDNVFIPFGGSGTDMEACIIEKRNYVVYEIIEKYYKIIKDREKICLNNFYIPDEENLLFREFNR